MPVWIKRIALAIAVLLVLAIAAGAWLLASFDPNRYKGVAIEWMKTNRNRTLAIDGPIELSVFPRVAVRLGQVSLSEAGRSETFVAIDKASLAVDVLPLLRGRVVVGRVDASGVRVQLLRDAKGRRNTDDLAGASSPPKAEGGAGSQGGSGQALDLDIDRIVLTDLRARVKDDMAKLDGELLLSRLATGRVASGVATPVELAASADFRQPQLKGELTGKTTLTPDLASGSVTLADMNLAWKGDLPGAAGVQAEVRGALAYQGTQGSVDARQLEVQLALRAGAIQLAGSSLSIAAFAFDPAKQALRVESLKLRIKGQRGKDPLALALDLDWPQLDVAGETLKGSPLQGRLELGGELPVNATFKSGAPTGTFEAVALPGFEATLKSAGGGRSLDGTLRANLGLQPARQALSLAALDLQAQLQDKQLKPVTLAVRGNANASPEAAKWSLAGSLNTNQFAFDGSANLSARPVFVKATGRFDALDLNTLLPDSASSGTAPGAGTPAPADAPVDLAALRAFDAELALRAGSLAFRQYRVADARVEAKLDNGMLRVPVLQAKAWGGSLDANALADARASRIAVKAVATGVNVNALLKDVASKDILEGTGRVALDVDTTGRTVGELRSKLRGNAALNLRDGAVKGVNLAKTLRQAKAALTLQKDAVEQAKQTEKTDFSELNATFQIAEGVARNSDLDVKSPFLRLGGDGAIDIGKGRIDYTARATVTGSAAGQGGAELAALKGLTVPVKLSGPFDAIDWKVQWSAVAAGALQNKVEDKLRQKLGEKLGATPAEPGASAPKPKDVLKEKLLKGLFK